MKGLHWLVAVAAVGGLVAVAGCTVEEEVPTEDVVTSLPWTVGEEASYSIVNRDGEALGRGVLSIEEEGGRLRLVQEYQSAEFKDRTILLVESQTLKPVSGERVISGDKGELNINVRYLGDTVEVERVATENGKRDGRIDRLSVPDHAYDTASSLFLWRTIRLQEEHQATYFNLATAVIAKPQRNRLTVRVAGRETVEVPAGSFQTWRLEIRSSGVRQTAWYGTSGSHPLVKYDNGEMLFLLESVK